MALQALSVDSALDCSLPESPCIIPELQESAEQYEDLEQLIRDGNDLGYVLDVRTGQPHFFEKYFAAMELEGCDTIAMALDIAHKLNRDGIPSRDRRKHGAEKDGTAHNSVC
ncbi:MAG: hypothetical protein V8Q30_04830 [Acutalibacteraceae bacterium]